MPRIIDVSGASLADGQPTVDGESLDAVIVVRWNSDLPMAGLWLDGERAYDTEVQLNGESLFTVPEQSARVDEWFDQLEAGGVSG